MNIQSIQNDGLCYALIDGMYNDQEIANIQKEIVFLETIKQDPTQTDTAVQDGKLLKTGSGIFVDYVYTQRKLSSILTLNRKIFDEQIIDELCKSNCFYNHLRNSNFDTTLINFYGNEKIYKPHWDMSVLTALTFFQIGTFSGGEFCFSEYDVVVDPVVGRTILFPGCVKHESRSVVADKDSYRVTMAQFIGYTQGDGRG